MNSITKLNTESRFRDCPFCGGHARMYSEWYDFHEYIYVGCTKCGTHTKRHFNCKESREYLLNLWNCGKGESKRRFLFYLLFLPLAFAKFIKELAGVVEKNLAESFFLSIAIVCSIVLGGVLW